MLATSTVVEIDNKYTRQRFKIIVPLPRRQVIERLRKCLAQPLEACVLIRPAGTIRVVIHSPGPVERDRDLPDDRAWRADILDDVAPCAALVNLGKNLARLIARDSIDLDELADSIGICPDTLRDILESETEATITELCGLAEFFGVTVSALLASPTDKGAMGWN